MSHKMTTFIGKVIGSRVVSKTRRWSNVYVYEPTIERVSIARGNLYLVMDFDKELEDLGTALINIIRENYYQELDTDALESLEEALTQANKRIDEYAKKHVTLNHQSLPKFNIACAVLCDSELHLVQIGEVDTYLIRKGRLNKISNVSTGSKANDQAFKNIASGALEVGDIITFATPKLFEFIPLNQFKEMITQSYPSVAASRISEMVASKDTEGWAPSLLVLEVNSDLAPAQDSEAEPAQDKQPNMANQLKKERDQIADKLAASAEPGIGPISPTSPSAGGLKAQSALPVEPRANRGVRQTGFLDRISSFWALLGQVLSGQADISSLSPIFLVLGILLLVIVSFKVFSGKETANPVVQTNLAFKEAWDNYTQAREVLRNNDFINAREYLLAAQIKAEEAYTIGLLIDEVEDLQNNIQRELDKLDGVTRLGDLTPMADLRSINENAFGSHLEAVGNQLFILDNVNQDLYSLTLDSQQLILVQDGFFEDADAAILTTTPQKVYIYAKRGETTKLGEFDPANDNFREVPAAFNSEWKQASSIVSWTDASGNSRLYFIDPAENAFWRYRASGNQFGTADSFFAPADLAPDFSALVDLTIDGNVFFLTRDGQILKYVLGDLQEAFAVQGLKVPMSDPVAIASSTPSGDSDIGRRLFVADRGNERILIFSKEDGQLVRIYAASDAFGDMRDIYLDEVSNFLYVLDGTKIYRIQL